MAVVDHATRTQIFAKSNIMRWLLFCMVPASLFYIISLTGFTRGGFSVLEIIRDTAQLTDESSFLGFLSSVGTWFWVSAAAISFFGVTVLPIEQGSDRVRRVLKMVGWFSLFLAVDDFFLIHDRFIAEGLLIPLYAIFLGVLLFRYRDTIFAADGFAFLMAGTLLALSVVVDAVQESIPVRYEHSQALEEWFKFAGAATWAYFCARLAAHRLINRP